MYASMIKRNGMAALILALLCWGCASAPDDSSSLPPSVESDAFVLEVAKGGGVAGLYTIYHLHADGRVQARQRIGRRDSLLWERSVDRAQVFQLRDGLLASGALQQPTDGRGNRTSSVVYAAAEDTVRWSWDTDRATREAIGAWHRQAWSFCQAQAP